MSKLFRIVAVSLLLAGASSSARAIGEGGEAARGIESAPSLFRTPPEGAIVLSVREYRALRDAGNWVPTSPARDLRTEALAESRDEKDLATITAYARRNELKVSDLVPPDPVDDPAAVPTGDGNFLHRVTLHQREQTRVVTFGRRWFLRTVANNIRTFPTKDNQRMLYQSLYEGIPERLRTELALPSPEVAARFRTGKLTELNRRLASREVAGLILSELLEIAPPPPPPGFLSDCELEVGAGDGGDRNLSCSETPGPDGIVENYDWALKPYITCVKAQGNRGTCTGFANVSAIEILVNKIHGARVNLSEQAYYNRARTKWDNPANYGDGHTSAIGFREMEKEGFPLYFENQWNYNPSPDRTADDKTKTYQQSCDGYGETCSDTTHQSQMGCVSIGPFYACGYFVPEKNSTHQGYRIGDSVSLWDAAHPLSSVWWMELHLAMGHPLVIGHPIITAWDVAAKGDGFVPYPFLETCTGPDHCPDTPGEIPVCQCYLARGGHGASVVGFITNEKLQATVPTTPLGDGGGYFIVKNSWGSCSGDGGFLYLPFQSVVDHAADVTALLAVE
jgi:hypothetical protein